MRQFLVDLNRQNLAKTHKPKRAIKLYFIWGGYIFCLGGHKPPQAHAWLRLCSCSLPHTILFFVLSQTAEVIGVASGRIRSLLYTTNKDVNVVGGLFNSNR